jgi:HEXXH motif-containing protein
MTTAIFVPQPTIDLVQTELLLSRYYAALAVRACRAYSIEPPNQDASWVSPAVIELLWHPENVGPDRLAEAKDELVSSRECPSAPNFYHNGHPSWWADRAIDRLENAVAVVQSVSLSYSVSAPDESIRSYNRAVLRLRSLWPEAADELRLLAPSIVFVGGGDFRSATFQRLFGVLLLGDAQCRTLPGIVEALVHEAAHLSLFLRTAYTPLLNNPGAIVRHPLLDCPRPLEGAFHAAYVLERMATVLSFWWQTPTEEDEEAEVEERFFDAQTKLTATIGTIRATADLTQAGARYLDYLIGRESELGLLAQSKHP